MFLELARGQQEFGKCARKMQIIQTRRAREFHSGACGPKKALNSIDSGCLFECSGHFTSLSPNSAIRAQFVAAWAKQRAEKSAGKLPSAPLHREMTDVTLDICTHRVQIPLE